MDCSLELRSLYDLLLNRVECVPKGRRIVLEPEGPEELRDRKSPLPDVEPIFFADHGKLPLVVVLQDQGRLGEDFLLLFRKHDLTIRLDLFRQAGDLLENLIARFDHFRRLVADVLDLDVAELALADDQPIQARETDEPEHSVPLGRTVVGVREDEFRGDVPDFLQIHLIVLIPEADHVLLVTQTAFVLADDPLLLGFDRKPPMPPKGFNHLPGRVEPVEVARGRRALSLHHRAQDSQPFRLDKFFPVADSRDLILHNFYLLSLKFDCKSVLSNWIARNPDLDFRYPISCGPNTEKMSYIWEQLFILPPYGCEFNPAFPADQTLTVLNDPIGSLDILLRFHFLSTFGQRISPTSFSASLRCWLAMSISLLRSPASLHSTVSIKMFIFPITFLNFSRWSILSSFLLYPDARKRLPVELISAGQDSPLLPVPFSLRDFPLAPVFPGFAGKPVLRWRSLDDQGFSILPESDVIRSCHSFS